MSKPTNSTSERVLTFVLEGDLYALDIFSVREILDMTTVTRIPQSPPGMKGVVNLRGNAVPVMDLRERFGLSRAERTVNTRIIIIELTEGGETTLIGAVADAVKEVLELDAANIDPPPRMGGRVNIDFIRGMGKQGDKFIILLDIGKVFSMEELQEASGVAASQPTEERSTEKVSS